jgi:hypothetical protein
MPRRRAASSAFRPSREAMPANSTSSEDRQAGNTRSMKCPETPSTPNLIFALAIHCLLEPSIYRGDTRVVYDPDAEEFSRDLAAALQADQEGRNPGKEIRKGKR